MSPLRDAAAYDSLATAAPAVRGLKPSESLPWALSPSGSSWRWPYKQGRLCALAGIMLLGGAAGMVGVPFLATAWFYDTIDTPRAVLSGGQPAPNPKVLYWKDPWGPPRWEREEA